MPSVAARTPNLAQTPSNDSMDSSALTDKSHHRDSRLVVEYQTPIPEEDESTETASEPTEPRTPTSDTAPDSHPFKQSAVVDSDYADLSADMPSLKAKPLPRPAPTQPQPVPRAAITRTPSNVKSPPQSEQMAAPERVGLSKRVGSFVRNKLHRTPSTKDVPGASSVQNEQVLVKTGVDGPAEVSSPPVNIPRYRRLSSFSLSARTTPKSSQGNSPPSPSSPTSTISNEDTSPGQKPPLGHKHSASSSTLVALDKQQLRPGITWAGGGKDGKKNSRFARRRSASTETVPKLANADQTVGLIDTFSKPAAEGVGMKARRLSMSLPDEFVVDTCDLEKEFKSSSVMPGKRGKCLGRGATAEVRIMARKGASGEDLVAVKEFRVREKDEREDDYVKKIQSEYSIAKSLHHPNIVETVRLCTNRGRWNHVMEFCQYGELFSLVERKLFSGGEGGYYSVGDRLCLFKQLLRGVDYLHSHGIAHRDIKLENLLMDKDGHLKISDFGVAEVFSGEHPGLRAAGGECGKNMGEIRLSKPGICGSLPYIAPEVLAKNGEYDPRPLDVWSCAIVYLTMTFSGCPWQAAKTEFEYYARFKKGWDEWLPNHPDGQIFDGPDGQPKCGKLFSMINPPPVKRLLLKMLHPIPEKRITIAEVVKTPVVKGIECCCPESFEDPTHTIDTSKCTAKEMSKMRVTQKHTHKPPKPESRVAKALTHRWDMGDGWT